MVRKGTPTTAKKESWKEWKTLQDKKKQDASNSDNDTSEDVVHCTGIAATVSAKSWASVVSSDEDDEIVPNIF